MVRKKPWLAAVLNLILPGLGYVYCRQYVKAILAFVGMWVLVSHVLELVVPIAGFLVLDAYQTALRMASGESVSHPKPTAGKRPWLAAALNLVLPGTGYLYCGKPLKGLVCALLMVGLTYVNFVVAGLVIGFAMWDGYMTAVNLNRRARGETPV